MERNFGIELEIYGITRAHAVRAINATGVYCRDEGYHHATSVGWKIVTDNSVRYTDSAGRNQNGFEVVSPILRGEAGLSEARKVVAALRGAGAKANKSCGLHVHVDAANFSARHLRNFVVNYMKFEGVFDEILAPSRRGNLNIYMKSNRMALSNFCGGFPQAVERIRKCASRDDVINLMHKDSVRSGHLDRFFKLNLTALHRHGTVEFRHHQGTVDPVKVVAWVRLLERFVNSSILAKPRWWKSARVTENEIRQRFFEQMGAEDLRRYYQARRRHFIGKPRKGDDLILSGVDPLTVGQPVPGSAETAEPEAEQGGAVSHHRTGRQTLMEAVEETRAGLLDAGVATPREALDMASELLRRRAEDRAARFEEALEHGSIAAPIAPVIVAIDPAAQEVGNRIYENLTATPRRRRRR